MNHILAKNCTVWRLVPLALLVVVILLATPCQAATGPQSTITCPAGAINIAPGQNIPGIVDAHPPGTTFCILAGTHYTSEPINPKANQKLIGQYGAIIDGRNVTMTYDQGSTSIIRGWNCTNECSGVTIQNLVIRNLPNYNCIGVNASPTYPTYTNNWTVDHNEVSGCLQGVNLSRQSGGKITNNYIHHNLGDVQSSDAFKRGFGFGGGYSQNTLLEGNEISYNGTENKWGETTNVTVRNNFVHHNAGAGVWFDSNNTGFLIEGNIIEDNGAEGIMDEISGQGIIRNNIVRRSGSSGIYISTSRDVEIYGNTLEHNWRDINLFVYCDVVGTFPYEGAISWDLRNVKIHDNIIRVGTRADVMAGTLSHTTCTSAEFDQYVNGSKNIVFQNNHWYATNLTNTWWYWNGWKTWSQWQAIPQDSGSTFALDTGPISPPPPQGSDTVPPTVVLNQPPESYTVSGIVPIEAAASDNVGVVSVQFKIDGSNYGAEDVTAPYSISWNTTAYSNGTHYFTAVARDAAGNSTVASARGVTVSNSTTPSPPPSTSDTAAPNFTSGPDAKAMPGNAVISFSTNEPVSVQVHYGKTTAYGSIIANSTFSTSASVNIANLTRKTTYFYKVVAKDAANNTSSSANLTFKTK